MKSILNLIIGGIFLAIAPLQLQAQVYTDPKASVERRVNDLLSRMTIEEKVGQMIQTERNVNNINGLIEDYSLGSVLSGGGSTPGNNSIDDWTGMYNSMQDAALMTRLKIPIIYGIDAVHGNNNVYGATIFPHNIGLGCTRDTLLVRKCADATAREVLSTGVNWTFSPCIAVVRDISWGRTYEGFGETTELQKMMARAAVLGYQGDSLGTPGHVLACAKHYVGDGGTTNGSNAGNTQITEEQLRQIHLPGYIDAIKAGVGSVMVSFSRWNGTLCHGNQYLITDLLKGELGFKGFVVSDWEGIHYLSNDFKEAVKISVNAGIDMFMEPNKAVEFYNDLLKLVDEGKVSEERIDDAVKRILTVKFKLGLFENPKANALYADSLGSSYHRSIAREAVRKSLVLLKNNGVLPLSKVSGKILVAGSKANDLGVQCGGWTISWQGSKGSITEGTTILQGIKDARGSSNVIYSVAGSTTQSVNVAVVVVGEDPYAESNGDNNNPQLNTTDLTAISNVQKLGIPYVVLLISGRPVIITNTVQTADAFVACWLPGSEGEGIADVLFGDYDFTGKLSNTWPKTISQEPINWGDQTYDPLFAYGYGLTMKETGTGTQSENSLSFYPNPAKDFLLFNTNENGLLTIISLSGEKIISLPVSQSHTRIETGNWNRGIYFFEFKGNDKRGVTGKFILQ
jgi:beta-glucosidase